jgi:hypothetical protein
MTHRYWQSVLLFVLLSLHCSQVLALAPPAAWMRADWSSDAPHLADAGIDPQAVGAVIGKRLLLVRQAPRNTSMPGEGGERRFSNARYVTAMARMDLPAADARHLLLNYAGYKDFFPLMTQSEVLNADGRNLVTRYRLEMPLPIANFTVDFRVKNRLEADGSVSAMLIDGEAKSMLAMIGGVTDSLRNQPSLVRWEVFPLDKNHCLVSFTFWDHIAFDNWLARQIQKAYPELSELTPYIASLGVLEAMRAKYSLPDFVHESRQVPGYTALDGLGPIAERLSVNGPAMVLYPEPALRNPQAEGYLRYVSVINRVHAPLEQARTLSTQYSRLPEAFPELKAIKTVPRGNATQLDLRLWLGIKILGFPLKVSLLNQFSSPNRLEFQRVQGEMQQIYGACEWRPEGQADTLMLVSGANVLGKEAPWLLRMFHNMISEVPYAGEISMMVVQEVAVMRLNEWMQKQQAAAAKKKK